MLNKMVVFRIGKGTCLLKYRGLFCFLARRWSAIDKKYICGYVRVPPGHKLFGKDYRSKEVDSLPFAGDLTFSGARPPNLPKDIKEIKSGWWLGFAKGDDERQAQKFLGWLADAFLEEGAGG